MHSKAATVQDYLASLPADTRKAIETVRQTILQNLPEGYEEMMEYGMIGYAVPLSRYPDTYNGQPLGIAALVARKNYNSVYLMGVYADKATDATDKTCAPLPSRRRLAAAKRGRPTHASRPLKIYPRLAIYLVKLVHSE